MLKEVDMIVFKPNFNTNFPKMSRKLVFQGLTVERGTHDSV